MKRSKPLRRGKQLTTTKALVRRSTWRRTSTSLEARKSMARSPASSSRARPDEPLAAWCELSWPHGCAGRAVHRHHRRLRAQGGTDERANTMDLCHAGHAFVHAHPALAYEHGWLIRGGTR